MIENFFDKGELMRWFDSLPGTDECLDNVYPPIKKYAIMTHDDEFDEEMFEVGKAYGSEPTFFILPQNLKNALNGDLQLHYNKELPQSLREQVSQFTKFTGKPPLANRNHKMLWRSDNLELANLAMNGLKVDSSKFGVVPFQLCVEGKLLPIWELPYNVSEFGYLTMERNTHAIYNKFKDMQAPFEMGITPIVGLFHPYLKEKSHWRRFYELAERYDYTLINVRKFYETELITHEIRR